MRTHEELDHVGGITYIGPRSFAIAFAVVCAAFLAIAFGLDRLTSVPDAPGPPSAAVSSAPVGAPATPATTAAAVPSAAASIGVNSLRTNAADASLPSTARANVSGAASRSSVAASSASTASRLNRRREKPVVVVPHGVKKASGTRRAFVTASAPRTPGRPGAVSALQSALPSVVKSSPSTLRLSAATSGAGATQPRRRAGSGQAALADPTGGGIDRSATLLVPFVSAKPAGSTALAPHQARKDSIEIFPQPAKMPSQ